MPPAVVAAAVTGAAALGGAALQSRGANRATDAQERATREAIQFQRERERNQGTRYDQQYQEYRNEYANWMRQFYGNNSIPAPRKTGGQGVVSLMPSGGAAPVAAPVAAGPGGVPAVPAVEAPVVPPLAGAPVAAPRSLADLGGWSDHRRYLGRV